MVVGYLFGVGHDVQRVKLLLIVSYIVVLLFGLLTSYYIKMLNK